MSEHLHALADVIREVAGIRLEPSRHQALRAALGRSWPGVAHAEVLRHALDPKTGPATIATLIDEITIKETSFLRDRRQLEAIDWYDLLARAREGGSDVVRVWSAACSTGAEPYSLALLACEVFGSSTPPVRIIATDISSAALASAASGRYRDRVAVGVEEPLRSRYLSPSGDHLAIVPALRALVTFAPHNLIRDAYPPLGETPFQLILCRNVLIYFEPDTCVRVVTGLERALAPGGRLALGAADTLCVLDWAAGALARRPARPKVTPALREQRTRRPRAATLESLSPLRTEDDPMNPDIHYLHGLEELESGDVTAAVSSLRRVLYLDPDFELAAFALGRAHEKAGEPHAARRRYEQALRTLSVRSSPAERLAGPVDATTVIDACQARLAALTHAESPVGNAATIKDGRT
jgi:chemotaxis protein methyltransferase CheR